MGCLFILFSVFCFFIFPPLGILMFLVGIVLLLMGIAGNTSRSNNNQRQIVATQSPQEILKREILVCSDPAAQSVLEGKLQTLVQQEREANARNTKTTVIGVVVLLVILCLGSFLFSTHTPQVTYTRWTPPVATPTPTPDTVEYVKGPDGGWHAPTPTPTPTPYQMATPLPDYTPPPTPGVRRAQLVKRHLHSN
jgi:hypothetical protein